MRLREPAVQRDGVVAGEQIVVEAGLVLPDRRRPARDRVAHDRELRVLRQVRGRLEHRAVRGRFLDPRAARPVPGEVAVRQIHPHVVEQHDAAVLRERDPRRFPGAAARPVPRGRLEVGPVGRQPDRIDRDHLVVRARGERHQETGHADADARQARVGVEVPGEKESEPREPLPPGAEAREEPAQRLGRVARERRRRVGALVRDEHVPARIRIELLHRGEIRPGEGIEHGLADRVRQLGAGPRAHRRADAALVFLPARGDCAGVRRDERARERAQALRRGLQAGQHARGLGGVERRDGREWRKREEAGSPQGRSHAPLPACSAHSRHASSSRRKCRPGAGEEATPLQAFGGPGCRRFNAPSTGRRAARRGPRATVRRPDRGRWRP